MPRRWNDDQPRQSCERPCAIAIVHISFSLVLGARRWCWRDLYDQYVTAPYPASKSVASPRLVGDRVAIGNISVSVGHRANLVHTIIAAARDRRRASLVFTPNIHHLYLADVNARFRDAYSACAIATADGWPVAALASVRSRTMTTRTAGSDLVSLLSRAASMQDLTIAILGGGENACEVAAGCLEANYPGLRVVYTNPVPPGATSNVAAIESLRAEIAACGPNIVFLGVGAPKQEIFAYEALADLVGVGVIVCVGAGINFLAGQQRRAPLLARWLGLEWLYRLIFEPRRLASRYVLGALAFCRAVLRRSE